ncbi:hypothetical protein [Burkholderia sp. MBR-1]|uniref:hypothetical protein n=1 Tax=Burkholderia sp. MBR-1 TaxID=2732364 RepID=UPI0015EE7512|nr:hypothetical protein [Burkholderia sp. MBR-1]QMI49926.1 hypothetical protein MBR110_31200 [Burkholderia sp. MBR-1]
MPREYDDWIIQCAIPRQSPPVAGADAYVPWPGYSRPMTADAAVNALLECEDRWPDREFRAHRLTVEEKLTLQAIERARRSSANVARNLPTS